jgi:hypothetical protein
MGEPQELIDARRCLANAEADLGSEEALAQLTEGLALLDDVIGVGPRPAERTARNLASTYATRVYGHVANSLDRDPGLPEPELEHFFKLVLAFDRVSAAVAPSARALKIDVVRRLIDRYYEGYPPERKERVLEELAQLARGD